MTTEKEVFLEFTKAVTSKFLNYSEKPKYSDENEIYEEIYKLNKAKTFEEAYVIIAGENSTYNENTFSLFEFMDASYNPNIDGKYESLFKYMMRGRPCADDTNEIFVIFKANENDIFSFTIDSWGGYEESTNINFNAVKLKKEELDDYILTKILRIKSE